MRCFVNIYVGNLAYSVTEEQLQSAFSRFGKVSKAAVIMDRVTNRSKGFGFVEMDDDSGESAISSLDGSDVEGRSIKVNKSKGKK